MTSPLRSSVDAAPAHAQDTDGDGLSDVDEGIWGTDLTNPDTDGDTVPDGAEVVITGTTPTVDEARCGLWGASSVATAQVGETSLLTRAGLAIAHAAKDNLIAMEGAFGTHLLQRDLTTPCLMFGDGGVLNPENYLDAAAPGLGLAVDAEHLDPDQP